MIKNNTGFTLIELLIVIAIISILASLTIPSYQQYLKRARFTEVILATSPYKIAVSIDAQEGTPLSELNLGTHDIPTAPTPTKNLASIDVHQGAITATATTEAGGYTYILTPDETGSQWTISGTCLAARVCKN